MFVGLKLAPAQADDFAPAWGDEFTGTGLPHADWLVDEGTGYAGGPQNGYGTDEIETMTNRLANVHLAGGQLVITPIRDKTGAWTSGRIETRQVFKPAAGSIMRVESRITLPDVHGPAAKGYWPAFWAMGETQRANRWLWPANGEFDFMESVNGIDKNWSTLHCGYPAQWGGPCGEPAGISNHGVAPTTGDIWGAAHLYSFEWDRSLGAGHDELRWSLDGRVVHTVHQDDPAVKDVWATMTQHNGYFLIFNVAMGGQFPAALGGGPDGGTVSGKPMLVDYVRVAYKGAAASAGGTATPPTVQPSTSSPTATPSTTCSPTASSMPTSSTPTSSTPTSSMPTSSAPTSSAPVPPPLTGSNAKQTRVIQAENYSAQLGTATEPSSAAGGTKDVTKIGNGDWLRYDRVDFGTRAKRSLVARVASGAAGTSILVEVRLDSLTGPVIGSFGAGNTGGWHSWQIVPANLNPTTGVHQVFLTFHSGSTGDLLNLDKFTFGVTPDVVL